MKYDMAYVRPTLYIDLFHEMILRTYDLKYYCVIYICTLYIFHEMILRTYDFKYYCVIHISHNNNYLKS